MNQLVSGTSNSCVVVAREVISTISFNFLVELVCFDIFHPIITMLFTLFPTLGMEVFEQRAIQECRSPGCGELKLQQIVNSNISESGTRGNSISISNTRRRESDPRRAHHLHGDV